MKGKILVTIQFTCLAVMAIVTDWLTLPWWVFLLLAISGFLAFWAMAVMKFGNFNIVPNPVVDGTMVSHGPYKLIRHPMYTSLLILGVGMFLKLISWQSIILLIIIIIALHITCKVEEKEMLKKFGDEYKAYISKTKMFIPYLY